MSGASVAGGGLVGRAVPRVEDGPLLRGCGCFVGDLSLPGLVHAAFVRSPLPHARIVAVDLAGAARLPGVRAAWAAAELGLPPLHPPVENPDAWSPPRPLLAEGVVRFVGEAVAVVVADDPYLAVDAAELVELELDPLVAVVDPALAPSGPALHANGTNVLYEHFFEAGEVDAAFAAAAVVVERAFRNPRTAAVPLEPRGVLAAPDGEGVRLWSSTQVPHRLATIVAELLGLPPGAVRVTCPDVGGGFGQKAHAYPEEIIVAALALRLGRPVRWLEDRSENLLASSHARDQRVRVRAAADADGRLLALDADVLCDQGAYGVFPHGHILEALGTPAMLPGPYRLAAYRYRSRTVATNKAPEGAYRGVGLPVSTLVHERLMDVIAGELGLDRAEIRRRNLLRAEDLPHTTLTRQAYDSGDYPAALERALELADWDGFGALREAARREGRLLGIGICCYVEYTGMPSRVFHGRGMVGIAGVDGAHVALAADGSVTAWTTLPAIGQGVATTFAQMVADELGVAFEQVTVERSDTGVGALEGTGAFASRSAVAGGGAVLAATGELRQRLCEDAAQLLEASPDDLELRAGRVQVAGSPGRGVAVGALVAADPERFRLSAQYDPPTVAYPYATHVCAVEVDPGTGGVEILRYVIVEDCGRVINPLVVEGQVHGATAQGIGGALYEEFVYDEDGQPLTGSLLDYLLPGATEVPRFAVAHLEIPAPGSANGAKGVGEGGTLAPPAAIANAVCDALGWDVTELPLRPEAVQAAAASCLTAHGRVA